MNNLNSSFVIEALFCDGCKEEFYHLVIHPNRPTSKWCMWCFGERFGVKDMEKQHNVYLKTGIEEAGYSYSALWEFPKQYFKGVGKKTLSTITVKDFNILSKTPDYIGDMIR